MSDINRLVTPVELNDIVGQGIEDIIVAISKEKGVVRMNAPTTVSELIDWFERNFICCVGPARAYFEILAGPPDEIGEHPLTRVVYETYAIKCGDVVDSEKLLVSAMYADFAKLVGTVAHETTLFWRYPEKIRLKTELKQLFGDPLVDRELVEDGKAEIPVGSVFDEMTSTYREDAGHVREWRLMFRACIPATYYMDQEFFTTFKREGAVTLPL